MATRSRLFTRLFTLVWIAGFLQELAWSLMIHFPGFLSDLGMREAGIGLLYSLSGVAGLLGRPMLGRLMDNVGRRPVLLIAAISNAASVAAMTLLGEIGVWLVFLFVAHRVFQIAVFTAMLTLSADVLPEDRRTEGLAIYGLCGLIPMATAGAIGDLLLGWRGFEMLLLTAAALAALSWSLIWFVPRYPTSGAGGPSPWLLGRLGATRSVAGVAAHTALRYRNRGAVHVHQNLRR